MDLYVRVHHRSTYRESIDVSNVTADGVCGYITDAMIFGDSRSDHAKQELRFIHSSVISSYSLMREVYRTVKELDLRILYCSLECELHLHGGSRNDEICTVLCCSLNSFLELLFCILAVTSQSLNDAGENFLCLRGNEVNLCRRDFAESAKRLDLLRDRVSNGTS